MKNHLLRSYKSDPVFHRCCPGPWCGELHDVKLIPWTLFNLCISLVLFHHPCHCHVEFCCLFITLYHLGVWLEIAHVDSLRWAGQMVMMRSSTVGLLQSWIFVKQALDNLVKIFQNILGELVDRLVMGRSPWVLVSLYNAKCMNLLKVLDTLAYCWTYI